MNRGLAIVLAAALLFASVAPPAARRAEASPGAQVSVSVFYADLSPWGHWVDMPSYGWCWVPDQVYAGWRPYSDGHWVYTDLGWTWVSDEPWSWAVYHYGRWAWDPFYGWVWVPGTEWAPAWVVWRTDWEWVGWAPMPPGGGWSAWFAVRSSDFAGIETRAWCFARAGDLGARDLRDRIRPARENSRLVRRTRDATRYDRRDGRPYVRGVDVAQLERRAGVKVPRSVIRDAADPHFRGRGGRGGEVGFYRPDVRRARPGEGPRITEQRRERDRRYAGRAPRPGERPEWRTRSAPPPEVREPDRKAQPRAKQPARDRERDRRDRDRDPERDPDRDR